MASLQSLLLFPGPSGCSIPRARTAFVPTTRVSEVSNGVGAIRKGGLVVSRPLAVRGVDEPRVSNGDRKNEKPIIVIDNYDSFTYNLCQYMGELGANFEVYRNDELTVEELKRKCPRGILISPGPGTPQDSGISLQTVLELGPSIPLFGVCMGLQCIGEAFGGKVVRSPFGVVHGKHSLVYYDESLGDTLFSSLPKVWALSYALSPFHLGKGVVVQLQLEFAVEEWSEYGIESPFTAGRYHSLVIEKDTFPSDVLEITAWTEDGLIMAARHKKYPHIQGVQFHPESIITTEGKRMVNNFVKSIETLEYSIPKP